MAVDLETKRLLMRPFTLSDVDDLHRLWTDPAVRKFLWDDLMISRDTVIEVVEASLKGFGEHGFGLWTISFIGETKTIGFCGLRHFQYAAAETPEVEVLYGLTPEHWGKGLATEAACEVLRYGFEHAGLELIFAGADPPNEASFRVMDRLGMKFLRRTMLGEVEAIYYVLHRSEFQPVCRLQNSQLP